LRSDIATDLKRRVADVVTTWRTPWNGSSEADATQAASLITADAQALRRIVARLGSPGRSLVGDDGCEAALVIALHSDHDRNFQIMLLRQLEAAVRRGHATTAQWARLYDRCLVRSGLPQKYGTQYWLRDGRIEPHPVTDPEKLDEVRAGVGLPPRHERLIALQRRHIAIGEQDAARGERGAA
jgi:hypothetical protein